MRKMLVIAFAIAFAITVMVSPAFAQACAGYGPLMGYMWGAGNPYPINSYGLGLLALPYPQLMACGPGPFGIGGFGSLIPFIASCEF